MERHVARAKGAVSKASVISSQTSVASEGHGGHSVSPGASGSAAAAGALPHAQSTPQVQKSMFSSSTKDNRRSGLTRTAEEEELPRRERDFLYYFGHLKEKLIDHTSCACQGEEDMLVRHGRIFISENHICFSSHIIGEYLKEIPFANVQKITKKNTAFVVPNAISVQHSNGTEFFSSMSGRDRIFDLLNTLWHKKQGEKSLGINLKSLTESANQDARKKSTEHSVPADNPFRKPVQEAASVPAVAVSGATPTSVAHRSTSMDTTPANSGTQESNSGSQSARKRSKPLDLSVFNKGAEENGTGGSLKSPRVFGSLTPRESGEREGKAEGKKEEREWKVGIRDTSEGIISATEGDSSEPRPGLPSLRGSGLAIGSMSRLVAGKLPAYGEYDGHLNIPERKDGGHVVLRHSLACAKSSLFFRSFLLNQNKFWNVLLRKAGYFNIQILPWTDAGPHHYARDVSMTAPLRSYPGLGHVQVRQRHQVSSPRSGLIIFDIRSWTEGETYSRAYEVWSRWEVEEREGKCHVTVLHHTELLKRTWVARVLEGHARDQAVMFTHKWMQRAEERLRNEEKELAEKSAKKESGEGDGVAGDGVGDPSAVAAVPSHSESESTGGGFDIGAILDAIPMPSFESATDISPTVLFFALFSLFLIAGALYLSYGLSAAEQRLENVHSQLSLLEDRAKFLLSFSARTQRSLDFARESLALSPELSLSDTLAHSWTADWLSSEASWEVEEWQRLLSRTAADVSAAAATMAEEMAELARPPANAAAEAAPLHRISGAHQSFLQAVDQVRLAAPEAATEGSSYFTVMAALGSVAVGVLYAAYRYA
eukprot:CAMPEP_0114629238 /NCGR_PEP_ID=MMETSP0168-20121206/13253_1 /TAXON_ID=95228 ORGANISM="Vannella sp., Strain DIVA3 517/6/12" /NCGR_SAMPLE_ID=MMETSP0168 /ASSEMBLY_ACC=CAM_ASM_000044 /LENGTH=824 /DNA_ID=CAMNT_0001840685 /DNA_START=27 /DNA_END=2499 /DNA_ORIENTATION=+